MAIILTGGECEVAAIPTTLSTAKASVDRRGAFLTEYLFKRAFNLPAPIPKACIGAQFDKFNTSTSTSNENSIDQALVRLSDADGNIIAQIRAPKVGNNHTVVLDTYNSAGVFTPAILDMAAAYNWPAFRVDLKASFDEVSGIYSVTPYLEGVRASLPFQFSAAAAGVGLIAGGFWGRPNASGYNSAWQWYIYDMILADDSTVGVTLTTLQGSSGGFYTEADGTYVSVSGLGVDPSTGLIFRNVGDKSSWIVTPLLGKDYTGSAIGTIATTFLAGVSEGSPINGFRPFLRVGGADYYLGPAQSASEDIAPYTVIAPVNPATGLGWTGAQVTAGIEFGLEAVA